MKFKTHLKLQIFYNIHKVTVLISVIQHFSASQFQTSMSSYCFIF